MAVQSGGGGGEVVCVKSLRVRDNLNNTTC